MIPGDVVISDDFGGIGERRKALKQPGTPESVVIRRVGFVFDQRKPLI
ncbi:hypothetical protein SDC9_165399 [bioreactor metagenome]|uniref:Uncharacterized protein n=1 Tax=bioreactor metagenome TaxID=1076179 RepID=A0A645FU81_9ZZZZ